MLFVGGIRLAFPFQSYIWAPEGERDIMQVMKVPVCTPAFDLFSGHPRKHVMIALLLRPRLYVCICVCLCVAVVIVCSLKLYLCLFQCMEWMHYVFMCNFS